MASREPTDEYQSDPTPPATVAQDLPESQHVPEPRPWVAPAYSPPPRGRSRSLLLGGLAVVLAAGLAGGGAGYYAGSHVRPVVSGLANAAVTSHIQPVSVADILAMIHAFNA